MKHARKDYNRFQDPSNIIPEDEPVFLIRGQDIVAPRVLRYWAEQARIEGASPKIVDIVMQHAVEMEAWQSDRCKKIPDLPEDAE